MEVRGDREAVSGCGYTSHRQYHSCPLPFVYSRQQVGKQGSAFLSFPHPKLRLTSFYPHTCPPSAQACNTANMLAEDGRCKTLDASANGYVRAEGVGALMLRAFRPDSPDTLGPRDLSGQGAIGGSVGLAAVVPQGGPRFLAVLAGTCVNQDGRSSSLTAPNGPSQQAVVRGALAAGGLLDYQVSMHTYVQ